MERQLVERYINKNVLKVLDRLGYNVPDLPGPTKVGRGEKGVERGRDGGMNGWIGGTGWDRRLTHDTHPTNTPQHTQPFHSPLHPVGGGPGAGGATGMVDDQARRLVEMAANTSRIAQLPPTWLGAL